MENARHKNLKDQAIEWLKKRGIEDIELEVRTLKSTGERLDWITFKVDIVGRSNSSKIAIECGGSPKSKLNELLPYYDEVWVFPYGQQEPYLWKLGMNLCKNCGTPYRKV